MLDRRSFLVRTGLALGTGALSAGCRPRLEMVRGETAADLQDWRAVRGEFNLSRDYIHLTGFLLASHPRPVREAIRPIAGGWTKTRRTTCTTMDSASKPMWSVLPPNTLQWTRPRSP